MSEKSYRKEYLACFGNPVDENPTVVIMEAAFREMQLNYCYNGAKVYSEDLETAVKAMKALHMKGANCTIPHKVNVMKYLDHIDEDAAIIGAVNTIYFKNGETYGANTDGKGFLISLRESGINPDEKNIVILGAGGAARAVSVELALANARQITIVNRTADKGKELVELIQTKTKAEATFIHWKRTFVIPEETDILINATNIGLYPQIDKPDIDYSSLNPSIIVCDVIPNPPKTGFLKEAEKHGCTTLDGLSMLVNQGVIALKIWTGKDAPGKVMKDALLKEFEITE